MVVIVIIIVAGGGVLVVVGHIVVMVVTLSMPVVRWSLWSWSHCQCRWGVVGRRVIVVIVTSMTLVVVAVNACCHCHVIDTGGRVVVVEERVRNKGLRENSEMCVYACVCVHNYISTLNYKIFLIVFTTLTTTTTCQPHHHHHQR